MSQQPQSARRNDKLTAIGHVDNLLSASTGLMYALRVLSSHGIPLGLVSEPLQATSLLRQAPTVAL